MSVTTSRASGTLASIVRKPGHFWFVHYYVEAEDGWRGPHRTIDAALLAGAERWGDAGTFYVAQGRRLSKREREDVGVEYTHGVDCPNALCVELPNTKLGGA
jgi:hypothetical protein